MMRCSPFDYRAPSTLDEAARILGDEGPRAMLLAGGTDLVPNMKRRQQTPAVLVSLKRLAELRGVASGSLASVGAAMTLAEVASSRALKPYAALQQAAASVATPHIRNAGTLGGNLCLDTRCNYYNQGFEWRSAIDFCMKRGEAGGGFPVKNEQQVCWVAPGSPRCWAVSSTDTAPALIALGASVDLISWRGERQIPLALLYRDDGIDYLGKRPNEILARVRLPNPTGWRSTYWKLRRRDAFDFPVLGVAAAARFDSGGVVEEARLVLGAVASHPLVIDVAHLAGAKLTDEAIDKTAEAASRFAKPLDNTDFTIGWRKRVAKSYIAGALRDLRG